jgi:hypothetical protein
MAEGVKLGLGDIGIDFGCAHPASINMNAVVVQNRTVQMVLVVCIRSSSINVFPFGTA